MPAAAQEPSIASLADDMIGVGCRRVHVLAWRDFDDPDAGGSELHADHFMARWAAAGLDIVPRTSAAHGPPPTAERNGYRVVRTISVTEAQQPVHMLNELEWVRGELWANVYWTGLIARIDPASGRIVGWVDVRRLLSERENKELEPRGGVANGIAYDSAGARVMVTGKYWPFVFQLDSAVLRPPRSAVRGHAVPRE